MPYDFTTWPTTTAVSDLLGTIGLSALATSVPANVISAELTSAARAMERATRRVFTNVTETRRYDGSGTGLLTIDPYVDVTAVEFLVIPGGVALSATQFVEVEQQGLPKTKLQIFSGPVYLGYRYDTFPQGRSNIQITAEWGYAATIPEDVWMATLKKATGRIVNTHSINGGQRLDGWKDDDVSESYMSGVGENSLNLVSEFAGWDQEFDEVARTYRRPPSEFRRRQSLPLI